MKMLASVACLIRSSGVLTSPANHFTYVVRGKKNWMRPYLKDLYKRREAAGPEPLRPRASWINWNYDVEIYSFGKRLGEEFNSETLKKAFIMRSYIEKEKVKRSKLEMGSELQLEDNQQLAAAGEKFMIGHIEKYISQSWPLLPSDGLKSVSNYLVNEERVCHVASNLGCKDLILTEEFPPSTNTICTTFKAVVGALLQDSGKKRAETFVEDFVLTQLVGRHILDVWEINNPMGRLVDELKARNLTLPEPRLISASAVNTILAAYTVGIYVDKRMIGKGYGETAAIAEQSAATDALLNLLELSDSRPPLPFSSSSSSSALSTR